LSKRLIAALFGVLALALVVAGCGSSDDGTDTTASAALTKSELIKQGDEICEKGNKAIEKEAEEFAEDNDVDTEEPTKEQQEEVIVDVVAPGVRQQVEEISDLTPPSGDEAKIEAMVAAVEEGSDELESDPAKLIEGENPLGKGSKLARSYGFKECGEE
jgi:ABC-type glycerol-3-phosphate transport system substrate-binding protein